MTEPIFDAGETPAPQVNGRPGKVLVTDFDGTMTERDFFKLAIARLLPPDVPDAWGEYRAGQITHFEALRRYFAEIRAGEVEILAVVNDMRLDPQLAAAVSVLARRGWKVIVSSAGCRWYIDRLLASAGVKLEVHANPGRFEPGRGLRMELPAGSPYFSNNLGIDKAGVVRQYLAREHTVAFAGDGFPDEEAALLVPPALRFARGDLANVLTERGEKYRGFEAWSEIAEHLG